MPRRSYLRDTSEHADPRVSPMELFFDLVFVFAVTQLSHYLLEHHAVLGALQTLVMFPAVWWAWIYPPWAVNWIAPDLPPFRLVLAIILLLFLLLSLAIPRIFVRSRL